jgi:hypothetical protein
MVRAIATGVLVLALSGCGALSHIGEDKQTPTKQTATRPLHRFTLVEIPGDRSGVAFDTQTGQICRTWEWKPMAEPQFDDKTGRAPQTIPGQFAPTCLSLYQAYPSEPETVPPMSK